MSMTMEDSIERWTLMRKTALVIEIIQGKTTVAEASRSFDLSPSEIEGWVDDARRRMRCGQIRWMSGSDARSSFAICRRLTARPCWSCVPEKAGGLMEREDDA